MTDVFIGRCQRCKTGARFVAPSLLGADTSKAIQVRMAPWGPCTAYNDKILIRCLCGGNATFVALETKESKSRCGPSCRRSTSRFCKCSCMGVNHGIELGRRAA